MYRHPDPLDDHRAWEAELARLEALVPVCEICNRPVAEEYYYEINDVVICAECLDKHFRKEVVIE